jgi:hypothetical protein
MKKLIIATAFTFAAIGAHASTPAETAGICAGNAYKLMQYGQQVGNQAMINLAREKMGKLYSQYGQQPGFKEGSGWAVTHDDTIQNRANVFDGCTKTGY